MSANVAEQILVFATIHAAQYLYTAVESWNFFCCRGKTNFGSKRGAKKPTRELRAEMNAAVKLPVNVRMRREFGGSRKVCIQV
ncbi:MAG: hypothetical protein ACKO9H_02180 [Planctomycetota bacterium]